MLYTKPNAAAYLAVSERTLVRLVAAGKLAVVRIGRLAHFDERDLEEFVESRKSVSHRQPLSPAQRVM